MSDDFNIKPVTPMPNINRLAPADRDRGKDSKNLYEKNENHNADEQDKKAEQDLPPNEPTDDFSDGHSINIKA
ncbi:MAG: hypothetical protein WC765_11390 [Phycisphaerae bacterium]|jgi:hypothetical protein